MGRWEVRTISSRINDSKNEYHFKTKSLERLTCPRRSVSDMWSASDAFALARTEGGPNSKRNELNEDGTTNQGYS